MSGFLKLSEAASLGMHAMLFLARGGNGPLSAGEIAMRANGSKAHMAAVLQRLVKVGLLQSTRGPKGGFVLGKPADRITLMEVYEAIEGPFAPGCCLLGTPVCGLEECMFGGILPDTARRLREHLGKTTLAKLVGKGSGKARQEESGRPTN